MSCWVVPSVAADLWGISVDQLMESVRRGEVPSRQEYHFLLIDVAPDSPQMPAPQPYKATPAAPPTYATAQLDADDAAEDDAPHDGPLNFLTARQRTTHLRKRPVAA
jgi:hypothetical protein